MTQPNLLELAKQGDAKAIAALINRQLQPKGTTAKAGIKKGCLLVFLEAAQVPDEQASVPLIQKEVMGLGVPSIHSIKVYGRRKGEDFPEWTREFDIVAPAKLPLGDPRKLQFDTKSIQGNTQQLLNSAVAPKPKSSSPDTWTWKYVHAFTRDSGRFAGVRSVAISPDGQTIATGSNDKTVKLWSLNTGQEVLSFSGHTKAIRAVTFSPDGQTVASGSDDKTIKVWNLKTGQEICTLSAHTKSVTAVAISPDGQTIVSGSDDKTIKLWCLKTGQELRSLLAHSNYIQSVTFSPDGQTIASGSCDKTIKLWNLNGSQEILTIYGHTKAIHAVTFSPDGKILASGSADNSIKLWSPTTGQEMIAFSGHTEQINAISVSPDGRILASGSDDKTIYLWDLNNGKLIHKIQTEHSDSVVSLAFSANAQFLVSGCLDGKTRVWWCAKPQSNLQAKNCEKPVLDKQILNNYLLIGVFVLLTILFLLLMRYNFVVFISCLTTCLSILLYLRKIKNEKAKRHQSQSSVQEKIEYNIEYIPEFIKEKIIKYKLHLQGFSLTEAPQIRVNKFKEFSKSAQPTKVNYSDENNNNIVGIVVGIGLSLAATAFGQKMSHKSRSTYVKPYRRRDGTPVKGYRRWK